MSFMARSKSNNLWQFGCAPIQAWPYHSIRINIQSTMRGLWSIHAVFRTLAIIRRRLTDHVANHLPGQRFGPASAQGRQSCYPLCRHRCTPTTLSLRLQYHRDFRRANIEVQMLPSNAKRKLGALFVRLISHNRKFWEDTSKTNTR